MFSILKLEPLKKYALVSKDFFTVPIALKSWAPLIDDFKGKTLPYCVNWFFQGTMVDSVSGIWQEIVEFLVQKSAIS
jgi:hypothetical protein